MAADKRAVLAARLKVVGPRGQTERRAATPRSSPRILASLAKPLIGVIVGSVVIGAGAACGRRLIMLLAVGRPPSPPLITEPRSSTKLRRP